MAVRINEGIVDLLSSMGSSKSLLSSLLVLLSLFEDGLRDVDVLLACGSKKTIGRLSKGSKRTEADGTLDYH